jgi:hypothetical protein
METGHASFAVKVTKGIRMQVVEYDPRFTSSLFQAFGTVH